MLNIESVCSMLARRATGLPVSVYRETYSANFWYKKKDRYELRAYLCDYDHNFCFRTFSKTFLFGIELDPRSGVASIQKFLDRLEEWQHAQL